MSWTPYVTFFVPGHPVPGGSKTASLIRRKGGAIVMKNGRPLITMRDSAKGNKEWRSVVAYWGAKEMGMRIPLDIPLRVSFHFIMPRPKGHYRTGKHAGELRPTAPTFHTSKPDTTKLIRACEDGLTGIVWRDDSIIAVQESSKLYGDTPGVWIKVSVPGAMEIQSTESAPTTILSPVVGTGVHPPAA